MEFTFEQVGTVGIFNFIGEITGEHEDSLKIALMRAIHSIDRAVLNFKKVTRIDRRCLQLLKQAYFTSVRLKNPLILIHLQQDYFKKVSNHIGDDKVEYSLGVDNGRNDIDTEAVCTQRS